MRLCNRMVIATILFLYSKCTQGIKKIRILSGFLASWCRHRELIDIFYYFHLCAKFGIKSAFL